MKKMSVWNYRWFTWITFWSCIYLFATSEDQDLFCGPLPPKDMSVLDNCLVHDPKLQCPTRGSIGSMVSRYCSPFYSNNDTNYITYKCDESRRWIAMGVCHAECGKKRTGATPLIVGGTEADKYEFPWAAAIYTGGSKLCAGSIVSPYHILTIAHCFAYRNGTAKDKDIYTVRVGKHYREPTLIEAPTQERKIKNLILHEEFRGEEKLNSHDIALIEVDKPFIFSSEVRPVCIDWNSVYEDIVFQDSTVGTVTGWGFLDEPGPRSEVLRKVNVAYWSRSTCYSQLPSDFSKTYFTVDKICAGYINASRGICYGDAGAGLMFPSDEKYYLRGIGSTLMASRRGCESNNYALYTKVSYYLSWLKSHMSRIESLPISFSTRISDSEDVVAGCALPNHIPHGKFSLLGKSNYIVNLVVPLNSVLALKCDDGHTNTPIFYCLHNDWSNIAQAKCNIPGRCSSAISTEFESYTCINNNNIISCEDPPYGTEATKRCNQFFANSGHNVYKCVAGKWNAPFTSCVPECGRKTISPRTLIINGEAVQEHEYPWVVAIYDSDDEHVCGGSIISRDFVISAAHCFTNLNGTITNKTRYSILAGKHYRSKHQFEENVQESKIKSLIIHPEYAGQIQNYRDDIALVELKTSFQISGHVRPVCIDVDSQYEEYDFLDGVKAVVAGWGYTRSGGDASKVLKKLEVPFVDKRKCKEILNSEFAQRYLTVDKICAGYHNMDMSICKGDSGSGLYFTTKFQYYIRGIASLTQQSTVGCDTNLYALYTKVSRYINWIKNITHGDIYTQYS